VNRLQGFCIALLEALCLVFRGRRRARGTGVTVVLRVLGEVTADVEGRAVDLGAPRQRCVLAALAVDAGRSVPVDRLVERVWGADAAPRARATLHSYVSRLRRVLAAADGTGVVIVRRSGGYALACDGAGPVVDLQRFRELCALARGDDGRAVRSLTEALALWRGEALTGVRGQWAEAERFRLGQERLAAEHDLTDAGLRAGQGGELVAALSARSAQHPLDERVAGQYLLALHRAGRSGDALEHYQRVRARMVEELGTEPGVALRQLHQQVLSADPALTPRSATAAAARVVPRQLPAAPAPFVGRHDELDRLDAALGTSATVVISAIAGAGGIGKTWLALHWAHGHADRFPDGQLFVDLRGFSPDGEPMPPAVAVRGFLDTLGVEPGRVPVDAHAQAALFRSLVAGKRMLLVLDNAVDTAQVTPLLPGGGSCTVLVTSRNRLPGLVTGHDAAHLPLHTLDLPEACALLARRIGAGRAEAERDAVEDLARLCGGFPLALSIVAGRTRTDPGSSLPAIAVELRDSGLDALDDSDPVASLPAVLSWSRRALSEEQAAVFALLATAPGPDVDLLAAASLTGLSPARTRTVLRALEQASLLDRDEAGRHRMHDLIRRYAIDSADDLPEQVREEALRRVLDFYTHTAHAADRLLSPHRHPVDPDAPAPGTQPRALTDDAAAMAWFDVEHANLLAAQQTAAARARHRTAWHLAWALSTFHTRRGHRRDRLAVWLTALRSAALQGDGTAVSLAHGHLGRAHADLGHHDQAAEHLQHALAAAEQHQDHVQQAHVHHDLARAMEQRGEDEQALEHATRALALYRTVDRPAWQADALNQVGWYAARLGRHDTARAHCHAALVLHRQHHNPGGEAATLDSLGYIDHHNGHHQRAVEHYQRALALHRDLDDTYQEADALEAIGHPHAALGEHERARSAWSRAVELYRQQGRAEDARRVRERLDALDRAACDVHAGPGSRRR
jgi:DNA-binding SARP family transcriptional activator